MAKKSAFDLFSEAMTIVKSKTTTVAPAKRLMLAGFVFMHCFAHVYETLSREGTDEDRKALADAAKRAWHEQVTPIDIPGVPDYIEVFVDTAMENALSAATDFGMSQIRDIHEEIDELLKEAAVTPPTKT